MKRILFVCIENACRSQMAEAFARRYGKGEVAVYSAGSRPSGKIDPKTVEAMWEVGYDLTKHTSKSLREIPDLEYDAVVTMGCGDECPRVKGKHREDWAIPDPKQGPIDQFREARNRIEQKVQDLLETLKVISTE